MNETRDGAVRDDRARWEARYEEKLKESSLEPSPLLVGFDDILRDAPSGRALDVACGNGRNAFLLASLGYEVTAVDYSSRAIEFVGQRAVELDVELETIEADLTDFDPGVERHAIITNFMFLDRNLIPRLLRSLVPGGYIFFETFTVDEAEIRGREMRRDFLLEPNEALRLFAPLRIVYYREGVRPGDDPEKRPRAVAQLIGRAPGSPVSVPAIGGGGSG